MPDSVVLPYLQVEDAHIFDRVNTLCKNKILFKQNVFNLYFYVISLKNINFNTLKMRKNVNMHFFFQISYQITEDNSNDNFFIDTRAFNVSAKIKKPLDRDSMPITLQGMYTLTVSTKYIRIVKLT